MADDTARKELYRYQAHASLVLNSKNQRTAGNNEPTGEAQSLRGKISLQQMGDRVSRAKPTDTISIKKHTKDSRKAKNMKLNEAQLHGVYIPKTRETKGAYDELLHFLSTRLGDQPRDVIVGAADEILAIVKNPEIIPARQQIECQKLLGQDIGSDGFSRIFQICGQINDFIADDHDIDLDPQDDPEADVGVAVVFDDSEDSDGAEQVSEVEELSDDEAPHAAGIKEDSQVSHNNDKRKDQSASDIISFSEIDAYWIQRQLSKYYDDANEARSVADQALEILGESDDRVCENKLVLLLDFDKFDLVKLLLKNKSKLFYAIRLKRAADDAQRAAIRAEMGNDKTRGGGQELLYMLDNQTDTSLSSKAPLKLSADSVKSSKRVRVRDADDEDENVFEPVTSTSGIEWNDALASSMKRIDLTSITFLEGDHTMTNKEVKLPNGSWRKEAKGYEEVHVPPLKPKPFSGDESLIPVESMPAWMHPAFRNMTSLNRIQSRIYETATKENFNMLVCAPTGAGKTNVAMLTILHEIGKFYDASKGKIDQAKMKSEMKLVYVAPMKALVQEVVSNFSQRLTEAYGIVVRELSGDQQLSRAEISETQLIVTTPEKWDIVTRRAGERAYTQLVRLVIIDEIHLLHNERGAEIEGIVTRMLRQQETTQQAIRLVGISATLPNYVDVALFLRVPLDRGLFFFDNSFRPVPLQQCFVGISEMKAIKRFQIMNEVCYDKIINALTRNPKDQVLVFVHSRKETTKSARALYELATERSELDKFQSPDKPEAREVLRTETEKNVQSKDLKEILQNGIAIHHAGLSRSDRNLVEDLFKAGYIKALVCTATLAWGVNLPAHTVIIKGTQVYNPTKGRWTELSQLDMLQMLGRAGRPQFDVEGEGIIITTNRELQFYLSMLNCQLPIESQLMLKLADMLNAEIVAGSVRSVVDAAKWIGYTYMFVRMIRNPTCYGVDLDEIQNDKELIHFRMNLAHSAMLLLEKAQLIRYDRRTGVVQVTPIGRVSSHFFIPYDSIELYNQHLKPSMDDIDIFHLFSISKEFSNIIVRSEEKMELVRLADLVPIPIKESLEEPSAKVNVLFQSYISGLKLEGYSLACDLAFVHQSGGRIVRALFELAMLRGWADVAIRLLNLANMVEHKLWYVQCFLRQFGAASMQLDKNLLVKLERNSLSVAQYFALSPAELGELFGGGMKQGRLLHQTIHRFPHLDVSAEIQPITRSVLKIDLTIIPDFEYNEDVCGGALPFWIFIMDGDAEHILHHEQFVLTKATSETEYTTSMTVPLSDPVAPNYFCKVMCDRFLHSVSDLVINFRSLVPPKPFAPHTKLLDLQPLMTSEVSGNPFIDQAVKLLFPFKYFNPIQTQTFQAAFASDENVLICAPPGSSKTVCAEWAMLHALSKDPTTKCVYLAPLQSTCEKREHIWRPIFEKLGIRVGRLTGDLVTDQLVLSDCRIILSTAEPWDLMSRRWKQRKEVRQLALLILDDLHLVGGAPGPVLEVVVSRMRLMASRGFPVRIVALSASCANGADLGSWIGAPQNAQFNFHSLNRPHRLEIELSGYEIAHNGTRLVAMSRSVYEHVSSAIHAKKQAIVFVPSFRQAQVSAVDLITFAQTLESGNAEDGTEANSFFINTETKSKIESQLGKLGDAGLKRMLERGVGYLHEDMRQVDRTVVEALFETGLIRVVIVTANMTWAIQLKAEVVVIMDTCKYDAHAADYVDYPVSDIIQMMGFASMPGDVALCAVLCEARKKSYYKKFLNDPLPIESHIDHVLANHMCAEIVAKTIQNKQDAVDYLTWTLYYRRLTQNPNYYKLMSSDPESVAGFLSELVENSLSDLAKCKCVKIHENDMDVSPLNLGIIASFYYIQVSTIDVFARNLKEQSKLRRILDVLCSATEFENVPIRRTEISWMRESFKHLQLPLTDPDFSDARTKVHICLQHHFSRKNSFSVEQRDDMKSILPDALKLVHAIVDIIASNGWLRPAIAAMELSQMIVQGLWKTDSPLLQIPHFTQDMVDRCLKQNVKGVFDIMELEDEQRNSLLKLRNSDMMEVAEYCNSYPDLNLKFDMLNDGTLHTNETIQLSVSLEREVDEDDPADTVYGKVHAPLFPRGRMESYWLLVGDPNENTLLSIKKVKLDREAKVTLDFDAPSRVGKCELKLYLVSDSIMGVDQERTISLDLAQGEEDSSSSDDSDSSSD